MFLSVYNMAAMKENDLEIFQNGFFKRKPLPNSILQ